MSTKRVLSIQSHVVSGYVGNKAATFPLQLHGFDVDAINSVQFSNHTGYPSFGGSRLDGAQLWEVFSGLDANGLLNYSHLITGYIGNVTFLQTVVRVIKRLKELNPSLVYVCDPVLGDGGHLYVPPELVPVYKEEVIKHADVLSLNQFEAVLLTGITIETVGDVEAVLAKLHSTGVKTIVLRTSDFANKSSDLYAVGSRLLPDGSLHQFQISFPALPLTFNGCGDVFSSLFIAWTSAFPAQLDVACEHIIAGLQGVLKRTYEHFLANLPADSKDENGAPLKSALSDKKHSYLRELRLVQSKGELEAPSIVYKARSLK